MQTSLMLVAPAKDPAKLSEPIFCEGHAVGQIEVRLNQKCPDVDGGVGPFLAEEKVLSRHLPQGLRVPDVTEPNGCAD